MTIKPQSGTDRLFPGIMVEASTSILVRNTVIPATQLIQATWELVDDQGDVLTQGSASNLSIANGNALVLQATVQIPEWLPATYQGSSYHWYWHVEWDGYQTNTTEQVVLYQVDAVEFGLDDTVTLVNYPIDLRGVIAGDSPTQTVDVSIFTPDEVELLKTTIQPSNSYSDRLEYEAQADLGKIYFFTNGITEETVVNPIINESNHTYQKMTGGPIFAYLPDKSFRVEMRPSLDPFMVQWHKANQLVGTSQSWIVNHNISSAMAEMKASMERVFRYPGFIESSFSNADYVQFLKMGRDLFNAISFITNFSMTAADGSMRRMWLICSQYEAANARFLEEAIKAFDFSGQSTTLTIDIQGAYESYKSALENQLDSLVRPYKEKITAKGITDGNGSSSSLQRGTVGRVSLTMSRVGTAAEYGYLGQRYSRYLVPQLML